ncbi:MAG: hypothetical protein COT55_00405, partial [Candidatus Diapherotrites archaeon CG09_land_8_20_14_0_10_32_12]
MNRKMYFVFILLFLVLFATFAFSKNYTLPKAEIYMKINSDASIDVAEKIQFSFSGPYTFAYRDIPKGTWSISNIAVTENGAALKTDIIDNSEYTKIKWYYTAENESKTFTINYRLENAIVVYNDVAELYWKVWGDGWEKPLSELYGYIEFPKDVQNIDDIYVWGHPELNGKIGLYENNKILFQIFGISSKQFAEIRTAFPKNMLESNTFAITKAEDGLQKIITEENYATFTIA